jgi:hypothetical protein
MIKKDKNFQTTEKSSQPLKQNTLDDISISEVPQINQKKFYLYEMLVLALGLSSNLQVFIQDRKSVEMLTLSLVLSILMCLTALLFYKFSMIFPAFQRISHPVFFLVNGFVILVTDPGIFKNFINIESDSFCPSLVQLVLRTSLQASVQSVINLHIISSCLGIFSVCMQAIYGNLESQSMYSLCALIILSIRFGFKKPVFRKVSSLPSEKYEPVDTLIDLDYSEIITQLNLSIKALSKYAENHRNAGFNKVVNNLEKIWLSLKKNKNIYNTKFERITKFMDDQDRAFIEQSCFVGLDKLINTRRESIKFQEQPSFSYGLTELMGALAQIGKDWNFDTFFIASCSGKEPLKVMGMYAVKRFGLDQSLNVESSLIESFFINLESSYRENPYHNSTHGADVMSSYLYLLNNSDLVNHVSHNELLAGIVATLGHDVGHPGKTNRFLVMTRDDIATAYNDISVLENMHASLVFNIMKNEENNFLIHLPNDKYFAFRKIVIEMILATDMAKHFDMMAQFRVKYYETENVDLSVPETKFDVFKIMMKASDIGHAAKTLELHEKWCRLVIEEFYEQGDLEKSLGIPVSMYCDRETTDISKSQAGFIKNIVYPLFCSLNSILLSELIESNCLGQLRTNEMYWLMRRKTIRGQSLIMKNEDYVNVLNSLVISRKSIRKPSLPEMISKLENVD